MTRRVIDRRRFLSRLGVAGATTAMAPLLAGCQQESGGGDDGGPILIGGMWLLSGSLSAYGEFAREGATLAILRDGTRESSPRRYGQYLSRLCTAMGPDSYSTITVRDVA